MKPMSKRVTQTFGLISITLVMAFAFQNCGKGFEVIGGGKIGSQSLSSFVSNCLAETTFEACIFDKDPNNSLVSFDQVGDAVTQTLGIKLPKRPEATRLANENLTMIGTDGTTVTSGSWKVEASAMNEKYVASLMAFYYGDKLLRILKKSPAVVSVMQPIRVVAGATATGLVSSQNLVLIKNSGGSENPVGYDGTFITHILVEAAISQITDKKIYDLTGDVNHRDCGPLEGPVFKSDCCATIKGCSKAVTAGLSDYFTAVVFETSPAIGEFHSGQAGGSSVCGLARNPASNVDLNITGAFDKCKDTGRQGQVFNMGSVLSSGLYQVRASLPKAQRSEFDTLVSTSLTSLRSTDDFDIYVQNLVTIDSIQFKSKFTKAIYTELLSRGFAVPNIRN